MGMKVSGVSAIEILDSRGRPTLATSITTDTGLLAIAAVPSGASTGTQEAFELRDGDVTRYEGLGVLDAARNVNGEIADALVGREFTHLSELDQLLIQLDGSKNKSRLGANAIVGVSIAASRVLRCLTTWTLGVLTPTWRHGETASPTLQRDQRWSTCAEHVGFSGVHDCSARSAIAC